MQGAASRRKEEECMELKKDNIYGSAASILIILEIVYFKSDSGVLF